MFIGSDSQAPANPFSLRCDWSAFARLWCHASGSGSRPAGERPSFSLTKSAADCGPSTPPGAAWAVAEAATAVEPRAAAPAVTSNDSLLVTAGAAALGSTAVAASATAQAAPGGVDGPQSAALFVSENDGLSPAGLDPLPLAWHQSRAKALQSHLNENGFAGAWLSDPMNITYFTGLFFTTTERPFSVFLPSEKLATIWFHPGLDRDLVRSWWASESESYFDF